MIMENLEALLRKIAACAKYNDEGGGNKAHKQVLAMFKAASEAPAVAVFGTASASASGQKLTDPAVEAFIEEVRAELMRARAKFPGDRIMTIALAEEFGELCKAVLDESAANVRKEAVQTAVMCARVVLDGDGSVNDWRAERGLDPLVSTKQV